MDIREMFERRVNELAVAEILQLIATAPHRREKPVPGDVEGVFDFWFDGGAERIQTGWVEYQFTNGASATVGAPIPALSVVIEFANGCRVGVQQESWGREQARMVGRGDSLPVGQRLRELAQRLRLPMFYRALHGRGFQKSSGQNFRNAQVSLNCGEVNVR